ncbi:unnamed protein product [Protopolystoma xenopodis]|uniref:SKI/SNO/DAC domain-containing protein n=1 Tax=Protopolystoma xenopodis TaxID=117903 RepID=A0A3S5AA38_9PLAT|nr:unnamed protein product [Protopolystoma xenopodis]
MGLPLELATSASSGMAPWASLSLSSAVQLNSLASAAVAAHNLLANSGLGQSASATGDASDLTVAFATASSGSTSICQSGIVSATPLPGPVEASDSEALSTVATETPEPATTLSPHDATWCMSGGQHGATRNYGPNAGDRMTGCYIPSEDRATKRLTSLTTVDEAVGVSATTSMTTSKSPAYCTPNPVPNVPENNQVRLIEFRGERLAAFSVEGRELVCLPQAFELFLKHLVGGLHTVYTKLKRLEIIPIVCNVEQANATELQYFQDKPDPIRTTFYNGTGAIQPGVNRCKLIAPHEFDILYADCTNSR